MSVLYRRAACIAVFVALVAISIPAVLTIVAPRDAGDYYCGIGVVAQFRTDRCGGPVRRAVVPAELLLVGGALLAVGVCRQMKASRSRDAEQAVADLPSDSQ